MENPQFRDIRVLTFPKVENENENKPETVIVPKLKNYQILISLSIGLIAGITIGALGVWLNPEQIKLRDLNNNLIQTENKLNKIKQCLGDI